METRLDAGAAGAESGWRLRLLVFVSGAVLMGLEMAGSRVLATHFGSSIYVWGSIIGVFLASLAAGYYAGGVLADRRPRFTLLNALLLAAGCWLLVIPFYAYWLCRAVRAADIGERLGPLVSTTLLFGGPSVLMGMASPFAVRLAARAVESVGNVAGRLYALSTFGSIVGTLVTAFWLIPALGVSTLLQTLGACLIVLPLIVLPGRRARVVMAAVLLPAGAGLFVLAAGRPVALRRPQQRVVYEADSPYHYVLVLDDERRRARFLQFNNYQESGISLDPPYETRVEYTNSFELARVFRPGLKRVLVVGGGGGVGARKLLEDDPGLVVDLVEIDPLVAELGFKYFHLERGPRLKVHVGDGRDFVRASAGGYDLVVLDAFTIGGQIPFHLTTAEFMAEVRRVLVPGGVLLANLNGSIEGRRSRVVRSVYKTLGSAFGAEPYVFPWLHEEEHTGARPFGPLRSRNVILVAVNGPARWTKEDVERAAAELVSGGVVRTPTFLRDAGQFMPEPLPTADVPVLTDDYAPVDTMQF